MTNVSFPGEPGQQMTGSKRNVPRSRQEVINEYQYSSKFRAVEHQTGDNDNGDDNSSIK